MKTIAIGCIAARAYWRGARGLDGGARGLARRMYRAQIWANAIRYGWQEMRHA